MKNEEAFLVTGKFWRAEDRIALTVGGFTGKYCGVKFDGSMDIGGRGLVLTLKKGKLTEHWNISTFPMIREFLRKWVAIRGVEEDIRCEQKRKKS